MYKALEITPDMLGHLSKRYIDDLAKSCDVIYILNSEFKICGHNQAWVDFALQNGGEEFLNQFRLHDSILENISGELRTVYEKLYKKALIQAEVVTFDYECSSAELFRKFQQTVYPLADEKGLVISNHLLVELEHELEEKDCSSLEECYRTQEGFIIQCSNCRKIKNYENPAKWDWIPTLIKKPLKKISHGICPICINHYYGKVLG